MYHLMVTRNYCRHISYISSETNEESLKRRDFLEGAATVKKIIQGGFGLAFHKGKTVFLPYAAPGDKLEFSVSKKKGNIIFGHIERIISPSRLRRDPECPNFGRCGGCDFLHLDYENEIEIKKEMVLETFERIGKIKADISTITKSPSRFGYRNHCIFRTDESGRPGFTMAETDNVIPFPEKGCLLLPEVMREAIARLSSDLLKPESEVRVRIDKFGAVHFWGLEDVFSPPDIVMEAGGYLFPISPGAFFQVNTFLNDKLIELVLSLPGEEPRRITDLYCGAGFFTFPLAEESTEVIGIEGDKEAYKNALSAAKLNGIQNVTFKNGRVEDKLRKTASADLILSDPPRPGMTAKVIREIIKKGPKELIIVSCDPPTLARDTSRLIQAGYTTAEIHLVDLFPGTSHIETVACFRKNN